MRHILLAVALMGIAAAIATTSVHAQLAIGPGGVQLGEPVVRHHGHHMRHEEGYGWSHEHYRLRSPPIIHHYNDDEEEGED